MPELIGLFGIFDPVQAASNILGIMKVVLLISGLCCVVGFLSKGRMGAALGAVTIALLLFYVMDSGQYIPLGHEIARVLTIEGGTDAPEIIKPAIPPANSSQSAISQQHGLNTSAIAAPGSVAPASLYPAVTGLPSVKQ